MLTLIVAAHTVAVRARTWWQSSDLHRLDDVAYIWAAHPRYHCPRPACPTCRRTR